MKTTKTLLLGAVAAVALTANQNIEAADFSPSDLSNRAVAASPRAKEQFPGLTREASPRVESTPSIESVLSTIKKNPALAANPRMREEFPELGRGEQPPSVASAKSNAGESHFAEVIRNRALAHRPRILEEFPELARGYTAQSTNQSFQIAPLK